MARLCPSLPLAFLLAGGCCWTPEPEPFPFRPDASIRTGDGGGFFVERDGGMRDFRDVSPPDAPSPADCVVEIPGGAACDDEPCVAPVRRITCPGGLQHLSVALTAGEVFLSASYPPRLLEIAEGSVWERPLPLDGEGHATLLVDSAGGLRVVYADAALAVGTLAAGTDSRTVLAAESAYWVVLGATLDSADVLHALYLDESPVLHLATAAADATSLEIREVSPTYFADSAFALGPDGVPHVAFWRHRTPTSAGRDLLLSDGAGDDPPHAIGFTAEPNDDGTNVSIAASATALLATLDFADGLHVLSPDDTVEGTGYRDVLVPGTTPLEVTGCPPLPTPGPFGSCEALVCDESGTGTIRRAHEIVRLPTGDFAVLWLERSVARTVSRESVCGEPGCACIPTTLDETAETTLVLGLVDPSTGLPTRTLAISLGDVVTSSGLALAQRDGHLAVAMQDDDLSAVLVDVDLTLLF